MDALTRAYAALGVRPGCSRGELKRAYRALVMRWHPDRHTADPVGQAEASRHLRMINAAMRVLEDHLAGGGSGHRTPAPGPSTPSAASEGASSSGESRPLSRSELDAIVHAVASESPVDIAVTLLCDIGLFILGALCFMPQKGEIGPSRRDAIVGSACVVGGIIRLIWRRVRGERGGPPTTR
jgi:hypothetical protein